MMMSDNDFDDDDGCFLNLSEAKVPYDVIKSKMLPVSLLLSWLTEKNIH